MKIEKFEDTEGHGIRFLNHLREVHRENGPAMVFNDGCKIWFMHDFHHRENGPCIENNHTIWFAIRGQTVK